MKNYQTYLKSLYKMPEQIKIQVKQNARKDFSSKLFIGDRESAQIDRDYTFVEPKEDTIEVN